MELYSLGRHKPQQKYIVKEQNENTENCNMCFEGNECFFKKEISWQEIKVWQ